jgi:hypothetical protein
MQFKGAYFSRELLLSRKDSETSLGREIENELDFSLGSEKENELDRVRNVYNYCSKGNKKHALLLDMEGHQICFLDSSLKLIDFFCLLSVTFLDVKTRRKTEDYSW